MNNAVQMIQQRDKYGGRQADLLSCSSPLALRATLFITIVFIIIAVFILVKRGTEEGREERREGEGGWIGWNFTA